MASTHKLLLFSKVSSNLVVLIHGVNVLTLIIVSVHLREPVKNVLADFVR